MVCAGRRRHRPAAHIEPGASHAPLAFSRFLSYRTFDPVYDNLHFDLNFPRGMKPYLITLQKDLPSPFIPVPKPPEEKKEDKENGDKQDGGESDEKKEEKKNGKPIQIDVEGIEARIIEFPTSEGVENYGTDPDIEVDNTPQDYARGLDAQLERAIAETLKLMEAHPPKRPTFEGKPSRALPKLPAR